MYLPPSIGKLVKELELDLAEDAAVEAAAEQDQRGLSSVAGAPTPGRVSRRTTSISAPDESLPCTPCIFCNGGPTRDSPLHRCETDNITDRVRKAAGVTGDFDLLAKLVTSGDLHAQDATYHLSCLVKLYNRERAARCTTAAETTLISRDAAPQVQKNFMERAFRSFSCPWRQTTRSPAPSRQPSQTWSRLVLERYPSYQTVMVSSTTLSSSRRSRLYRSSHLGYPIMGSDHRVSVSLPRHLFPIKFFENYRKHTI